MKKLAFFLFIITCTGFAQGGEGSGYDIEIFVGTQVDGSSGPITFTLINQSQVWGMFTPVQACENWSIEDFFLTNDLNTPSWIVTTHNQEINTWGGFEWAGSGTSVYPPFMKYGFGLYKVTVSGSSRNFYIDFRDDNAGCFGWGTVGSPTDIWIKYNITTNTLYLKNGGSLQFEEVPNGEYIDF